MISTNSQLVGLTTLLILTLGAWWSSFTKMTQKVACVNVTEYLWLWCFLVTYVTQLTGCIYCVCVCATALTLNPNALHLTDWSSYQWRVKEIWLGGKILTNIFCIIINLVCCVRRKAAWCSHHLSGEKIHETSSSTDLVVNKNKAKTAYF